MQMKNTVIKRQNPGRQDDARYIYTEVGSPSSNTPPSRMRQDDALYIYTEERRSCIYGKSGVPAYTENRVPAYTEERGS